MDERATGPATVLKPAKTQHHTAAAILARTPAAHGSTGQVHLLAPPPRRGVAKISSKRLGEKRKKKAGADTAALAAADAGAKPMSIFGVLAVRRLARHWLAVVRWRRSADRNRRKQPTYRMEPAKRFHPGTVHLVVKSVTSRRMDNYRYNVKSAALMAKLVAMEVKEAVKDMNYDRYKIVCLVTVGQKNEQGLLLGGRCSWNAAQDSSTTYVFENNSVFCSVSVYGVYRE